LISPSTSIPEDVPDGKDPEVLKTYLTQVKLYAEELARLAQSIQSNVRSTIPGSSDVAEGEFVPYVNGATIRIYTKVNGVIRYFALT
jgi:hypothetical protein